LLLGTAHEKVREPTAGEIQNNPAKEKGKLVVRKKGKVRYEDSPPSAWSDTKGEFYLKHRLERHKGSLNLLEHFYMMKKTNKTQF